MRYTLVAANGSIVDRAFAEAGEAGRARFSFGGLATSLNNPVQLLVGLGVGAIEGGILDPLEGLASLPGINLLKADDFLSRVKEDLYSAYENFALSGGMTSGEAASAYATGDFFGMMAPVGVAIGLSKLTLQGTRLLRTAQATGSAEEIAAAAGAARTVGVGTIKRHLMAGDLITETVAGVYYGALFTPAENMEQRVGNILRESASFGLGRLMVNTLARPMRGYQLRRKSEEGLATRITELSAKLEETPNLKTEVKEVDDFLRAELQLQGEEHYILASALAQDLLPEGDDLRTLITAVSDMHVGQGQTRGAVRMSYDASANPKILAQQVDRLNATGRGVFELLEVPLLRKDGTKELIKQLHWGPEKLTNTQRGFIHEVGFFPGQTVYRGTGRFTFTKMVNVKGKRLAEYVNAGGTTKVVDPRQLKGALGGYSLGADRSRIIDDFSKRFGKWVDEAETKIMRQTRTLDSAQTQAAAQLGKLDANAAMSARRNVSGAGAIINPEDLGFVNDLPVETIEKMQGFSNQLEEITAQIKSIGAEIDPNNPDEAVMAGLQKLQQQAQQVAGELEVLNRGSAEWVVKEMAENGTAAASLVDSVDLFPIGTQFDAWAKVVGLDPNAPDFAAIKGRVIQARQQELWNSVDGATKDLISKLLTKQLELIDEVGLSTEALGASKGFQVFQKIEGLVKGKGDDVVVAHDVYSGKTLTFRNEQTARDAFESILREQADGMSVDAAFPNIGLGANHGGRSIDEANGFFGQINKAAFGYDTRSPLFTSTGKFLEVAERKTGIPLFTQIFEPLDRAIQKVSGEYDVISGAIDDVFRVGTKKGPRAFGGGKPRVMDRADRLEIGAFFSAFGSNKTIRQLKAGDEIEAARAFFKGPNAADQIKAVEKLRVLYDDFAVRQGLEANNYMAYYYGTMRGAFKKTGTLRRTDVEFGLADAGHPAVEAWADGMRKGDMSGVEFDPYLNVQKYARNMLMRQEFPDLGGQGSSSVNGLYDRAMNLVNKKVGQLTPGERARFQATGVELPNDPNAKVLGGTFSTYLETFLNGIRGGYNGEFEASTRIINDLLTNAGVQIEADVVNKLVRSTTTLMYGSAMGLRGAQISRNLTQNLWMGWTQLGSRDMGRAISEVVSDPRWYKRALGAGVLRQRSGGLEARDAFTEAMLEVGIKTDGSALGIKTEEAIREMLRKGEITAKAAELFLIPFTDADGINRTIAFAHNIMHTERWLGRLKAGDLADAAAKKGMSERTLFMEEAFKYKPQSVRDRFMEILDTGLEEDALDYIGKIGADQWNFVYMQGGMPQWMQKGWGRMFGMFGSYPIGTLDWIRSSMRYATPTQRAELGLRAAALTGIFANMGMQTGVNMDAYFAYPSVNSVWAGGPIVDTLIDARETLEAPAGRRRAALGRFGSSLLRMTLPGQGLAVDIWRARDSRNPLDWALRMLVQRPALDESGFQINFESQMYSGTNLANIQPSQVFEPGDVGILHTPVGAMPSTKALQGARDVQGQQALEQQRGLESQGVRPTSGR